MKTSYGIPGPDLRAAASPAVCSRDFRPVQVRLLTSAGNRQRGKCLVSGQHGCSSPDLPTAGWLGELPPAVWQLV